ncbi:hypothetical protein L873DRAFT_1645582, partial [Choiromyces venosus 120613-1]
NISREHASLTTHVGGMQDLPALDVGGQILNAIGALSQHLDNHFDEVNHRFEEVNRRLN